MNFFMIILRNQINSIKDRNIKLTESNYYIIMEGFIECVMIDKAVEFFHEMICN
jgi:pentatricopeptide repeat protein